MTDLSAAPYSGVTTAAVPTRRAHRPRSGLPPAPRSGWHQFAIDVPGSVSAVPVGSPWPGSALPVDRHANDELSWLGFASRLLDLASDQRLPLLERMRFLTLSSETLDDFLQMRAAALEDQVASGPRIRALDGTTPGERIAAITASTAELVERRTGIFRDQLRPGLAAVGLAVADWPTLHGGDRAFLSDDFNRRIFPILTPLAVHRGHPFPYIATRSLNLLVRVCDPRTGDRQVARVEVPSLLPRLVPLPDGRRFVPVEQVIAAHLEALFPSMRVTEHHAFRVIRNAARAGVEDHTGDRLASVELELRERRFGRAVRLEVSDGIATDLLELLIAELDVPRADVVLTDVPVDLAGLGDVTRIDRPDLGELPCTPVVPPPFAGAPSLLAVIGRRDVLVHHPYESFAASVEAFVSEAADDPTVVAIKQTLYRAGPDSPIVDALIRASGSGKRVTAVVELRARFDEQANITWARTLEQAGVRVVYGLASLKTHAKISLVVRREAGGIRRYCHLGTGDYNSLTARTYEDLGLFTADGDIGADVETLFDLLTGSGAPPVFRRLAVSPVSARRFLIESIADEERAGPFGRIVLKTNGLTDPGVIDALYRASQAGVPIDLIVRGRCSLRPGVAGLSETITVRSIVGRHLEHSRIFRFGGTVGRPLRVAIGSPDLMVRNLDSRVEVIVPVDDPDLRRRLIGLLDLALLDEANSWQIRPDGGSVRLVSARGPAHLGVSLQGHLRTLALDSLHHQPTPTRGAAPPPSPGPMPPVGPKRWWHRLFRTVR